jgi:hypothetical protein
MEQLHASTSGSTREPSGYTAAPDAHMDTLVGIARFAPILRPDQSTTFRSSGTRWDEAHCIGPHAHVAGAGA